MKKIIKALIMLCMQKELNRLRQNQDTPYIYISGNGKDYPKYLMYTDNDEIRRKMHSIK